MKLLMAIFCLIYSAQLFAQQKSKRFTQLTYPAGNQSEAARLGHEQVKFFKAQKALKQAKYYLLNGEPRKTIMLLKKLDSLSEQQYLVSLRYIALSSFVFSS